MDNRPKLTQWFSDMRNGRLKIGNLFRVARNEKYPPQQRAFFVEDKSPPPQRLRFPGHFTENAHLRNNGRADWQGVDPRIKEFAARFVEEARKRGIPLYAHCAYRTKAEQTEAWASGNSKLQWPDAPHCKGLAVDIVHSVFHWDMSEAEWDYLRWLGYQVLHRINDQRPKKDWIILTWGGDWDGDGDIHDQRLYDPAHWEIADWRSRSYPTIQETEPVRLTPRAILAFL